MAEVIYAERKSYVLKHPSLKCLAPHYAVNLAAGCPYGCRYCYAQSFRNNPGLGKVIFYRNTYEMLSSELPRKRVKPRLVYFSTACEPFMAIPDIQACLFQCMELLLHHGCFLLISTKSHVPAEFVKLFQRFNQYVHVQMGITTIDDDIRRLLEPNADAVEQRLDGMRILLAAGIPCEARMDPLIPELTDTTLRFTATMAALRDCGVANAAASYLFLRRSTYGRMRVGFGDWDFKDVERRLFTDMIEHYCEHSDTRIVNRDYRLRKYQELRGIAIRHGVKLVLCSCKNPDIVHGECCHPLPGQLPTCEQPTLL